MKTEFKAKFLQHINKRRQDQGFTLIELLVVIIIIGILSAIALPAFLNQANKAKQSEAKQYIASINKGQQAYYAENGKFTTNIPDLGLGLKTETTNYKYTVTENAGGAAINSNATPTNTSSLRAYGGAVVLVTSGEAKTTQTSICEAKGDAGVFNLTDCSGGWSAVTK
jgi:type IV pilus assembly protein PilA